GPEEGGELVGVELAPAPVAGLGRGLDENEAGSNGRVGPTLVSRGEPQSAPGRAALLLVQLDVDVPEASLVTDRCQVLSLTDRRHRHPPRMAVVRSARDGRLEPFRLRPDAGAARLDLFLHEPQHVLLVPPLRVPEAGERVAAAALPVGGRRAGRSTAVPAARLDLFLHEPQHVLLVHPLRVPEAGERVAAAALPGGVHRAGESPAVAQDAAIPRAALDHAPFEIRAELYEAVVGELTQLRTE